MLSGKHPVLFWVFQESLVIAPSHDAARERFSDNSRGCPFSRFTKWVVRRVDVCKCFRSAYISWRFLERRETPKKLFSETSIIISYVSACFQLIWNSFDVEILVSTFFPKIAQHLVENCLLRTGLVRSHFLWEKIHDIFMTLSPLIFYEKKIKFLSQTYLGRFWSRRKLSAVSALRIQTIEVYEWCRLCFWKILFQSESVPLVVVQDRGGGEPVRGR